MSLYSEELVRADLHERLDRAARERRATQLVAARRLSRKAERAAAQARLALARII